MKFKIITLFPDFIAELKNYSIIGRGIKNELISLETINLREYGLGRHKQVDDSPYGGGAGMVLRVDVMNEAINAATKSKTKKRQVIMLTPEGKKFDQKMAGKLAKLDEIVLVCGHYEGFDARIDQLVDEKISLGDFVVSGGEIPAMMMIDAISRQIKGILGNPSSLESESFDCGEFDYPTYTKPEDFKGQKVPPILLSGNHAEIEKWRKEMRGHTRA